MAYLGESIPKLGFGLMRLPKLEDGQTIDVDPASGRLLSKAGAEFWSREYEKGWELV